jgi:hypothetical protein
MAYLELLGATAWYASPVDGISMQKDWQRILAFEN